MNPFFYLLLAKDLVERVKKKDFVPGTTGQAECRSSISRAYYAAYHVALAFFNAVGLSVPGTDGHKTVIECLRNSTDSDLELAAGDLEQLHQQRHAADYRLDVLASERVTQAESSIKLSEEVMASLNSKKQSC